MDGRALRQKLLACADALFGSRLRAHRIPFGPNAGARLYTRPGASLRMYLGLHDPQLVRAAARLLRPGDVVYDLGANVGYFTVLFARLVGPSGSVEAFELVPSTAGALARTIELNELAHVRVHALGVADREAELRLPVGAALSSSAEQQIAAGDPRALEPCRVVPLDAYRERHSLPPPTLLKLDVEGSEVRALRGAEGTLSRHRPLLLVEFHNMALGLEGHAWLATQGYGLAGLDGTPVTPQVLAGLAQRRRTLLGHDPSCAWHRERLALLH